MHCPKCGTENFNVSNPCVQCAYEGEASLLEQWGSIQFLLRELSTWSHLPEFYRENLREKYSKQRREVEVDLGWRQPPLNNKTAEIARQRLSDLRAFTMSGLDKWSRHDWLTPDVAAKLRENSDKEIITLQEQLVDAPDPDKAKIYSSFDQTHLKHLHFQLDFLAILNQSNQLANEGTYDQARAALTAEIHQLEIKLGLRQPPPPEPKPKPVPTINVQPSETRQPPPNPPPPARSIAPPPPPRPALSWDRVWETLLSERTLRAILFMGATLLFAAAVSLVIWNWGTFPPWLQVTFLASFTALFYGLGWYVRSRMKLIVSGIALSAVASLLVPIDFYAFYLSGGFLSLSWSDVWLLTSAVCLAAYLLTLFLVQAEFFGYLVGLAAGSLLTALLQFGSIEQAWWLAALSGLALTLALSAVILSPTRNKLLQKWQVMARPFWHLAVGGVTAILVLSTSLNLLDQVGGTNFLTSLAISWWFGGLIYLLALSRFQMRLIATAAALSFPVAVLLTQYQLYISWEITAAWYALGWALLTPLNLFTAHHLRAKPGPLRLLGHPLAHRELRLAYGRIALVSCLLLILLAFAWALGDAGAIALSHLILALTTIAAVRLFQRPNFLFFTSLLLISAMAGLVSSAGGTIAYLGVGWALLAIGHLAAALRLENRANSSPYPILLFRAGWLIGALALLPPLITRERPLLVYTLANWIGLNAWLALLAHEERLKLVSFWLSIRGRLLRLPDLTFQWMAALLLPLWLWLAWDTFQPTSPKGPPFLALAWLLLLFGNRLRQTKWRFGRPSFVAAQLSALIALFISPAEFDQPRTAVLFITATLFYSLSARLLHNRWWLVMAGLTFPIGLLTGLDWLDVPFDPLVFSLSLAVLAYIAGPLLAHHYWGLSKRYQRPLKDVAYFIGAAVFLLTLSRILLSNRSDSILLWMAAAEGVLALAVAIYAWSENEEGFAHIAAWLGVLSGGLLAGAFSQGRGSSAAKAALLAVIYIVAERALRRAALNRRLTWRQWAGRGWRLFRRPFLLAGWGVSFIAIFLALLRNMLFLGGGWTRETWAIIALLLITNLYLVSSWLFRRYPRLSERRVWWAAVLIFFPWTLLTHRGWYLGGDPPTSYQYVISWTVLALCQLAIAAFLTSRDVDKRWIKPPKIIANLLLPFFLLWGIDDAAASSISFGLGVLFYLLAVYLDRLEWQQRRRLAEKPLPALPPSPFLFAAAGLIPVWSAFLLENFAPNANTSSFGLLLLAHSLPFWLLARWLERKERVYRMPFYLVAYATAVIGTFLVVQDQQLLIGALLFDALLGIISARFFKQSFWLYTTTVTFAAAWMLTLDQWGLPSDRYGWGLAGLSQIYLIVAWALSNWNRNREERPPRNFSDYGLPFLLGVLWLISLSVPITTTNRLGVQIGYSAVALVLIQTAVWLRQPIFSALAAGLFVIPYWLTIPDLILNSRDFGLALWPLILTYLLIAFALDKFVGLKPTDGFSDNLGLLKPFPWHRPFYWFNAALGRLLHWWALPFYGLAFSLAGSSVLASLRSSQQLTIVLLLSAVIFGWATAYFRLRGWLLLTIAAAQMAFVSGTAWLNWWDRPSELALLFLPITFMTALLGLAVERKLNESPLLAESRLRWQGWSRPFFALLAVNLFIGQIISLNYGNIVHTQLEGIWITTAHTILITGLALWWASNLLALVPVSLGLILLVQTLFYQQAELTSWPPALAFLALGYGLAGCFLRLLGRWGAGWVRRAAVQIWEWPLLAGGWLISILSWLTVGFSGLRVLVLVVLFAFRLKTLTPNDVAQVQMVVAVLALLGLFYLAAAVVERQPRLGYFAMAMLLLAWSLEWSLVWNQREVQWYAIPAGTYLLVVGFLEWHSGSRSLARWIDRLALLLLLGTSFWQSLGPTGWPYALLMGLEGLMITWWGSTRRLRRFLYAGVFGVTIDVTWQLIDPLLTATNRWIVFGIVGVFLVSLAIIVERRLEKVMALTKDVRRRLENWE